MRQRTVGYTRNVRRPKSIAYSYSSGRVACNWRTTAVY